MPAREHDSLEATLFVRWLDGEEAAFRGFYDAAAPTVLAIARRYGLRDAEARDVLQLVFLGVHRARGDFRRGAPVRPWLVTITRNVVRDHLRRLYSRREDALDTDGPIEPSVEAPEYGLPSTEALIEWSRKAVTRLPEGQRRALELHFFEGLPFAEVARALGCTEGAARVRAHRGYETIRGWLVDPSSVGLEDPFG